MNKFTVIFEFGDEREVEAFDAYDAAEKALNERFDEDHMEESHYYKCTVKGGKHGDQKIKVRYFFSPVFTAEDDT